MLHRRWLLLLAVVAGLTLPGAPGYALDNVRTQERKARLERMRERFARVPDRQRAWFSSALANMEARAKAGAVVGTRPVRGGFRRRPLGGFNAVGGGIQAEDFVFPTQATLTGARVSDPKYDVSLSRLGGFTQSETSTAWCSPNVVVAFNDSGSYLESLFYGSGGLSFNGYSTSANNGTSFKDQGFLPASSDPGFFLSGDPVVRCTDQNTFYQASLLEDYGTDESAISVSKSTNGGLTFGDPVKASSKEFAGHFLDKEWMAVDPTNPNNIYVTYTDFDSTGDVCGNTTTTTTSGSTTVVPIFRTGIEFVRSIDGGVSWSAPIPLSTDAQSCDPSGNQGSFVEIGPSGEVYAAWLNFPPGNPNNEILIRKSTNFGVSFSPSTVVTQVYPMGAFDFEGGRSVLQGRVRFNQFPHMAVDRSTGARRGHVYITWADGRYLSKPDFFSDGFYNYADVFVSRSTDGGATWSQTSAKVNSSAEPPASDQFFPGIAVDRTGAVKVCFYDNRRDVANFLWDRECAASTNGGLSWVNTKVTATNYPGLRNQDGFVNTRYQGDYDDVASDNRRLMSGFRGGYADHALGNQDIKLNK